MATMIFGTLREDLAQKLAELGRQINHLENPDGYPFDPEALNEVLGAAIAGELPDGGHSDIISIRRAISRDRWFMTW